MSPKWSNAPEATGLCASCCHRRWVGSARGSRFVLCQLPPPRPDWPKYPRLPVLRCEGYERGAEPEPDPNPLP
jgi:hypothetical protein